jgi:hypothetical protein
MYESDVKSTKARKYVCLCLVRRIYFAICVFYKIENAGILRLAGRLWEEKEFSISFPGKYIVI